MSKLRNAAIVGMLGVVMAVGFVPVAFASGAISCTVGCTGPGNTVVALSGPGSSTTITLQLVGGPAATAIDWYACPHAVSNCSVTSGNSHGWLWSLSPTSGTTDGAGSLSTQMTLTAPSVLNSSNTSEEFTLYACTPGAPTNCFTGTQQASLTVTASVPEFAVGVSVIVAVGLLGMLALRRRAVLPAPV